MSADFRCRSCATPNGELVLDLGPQPFANNLLRPEDLGKPEPRVPLRLFVCRSCWLAQISDLVPPVELFSEYLYFSSFSDAMLRHAATAAQKYIAELSLGAESLVVEVASNDGYLLQNFVNAGIPALGIEPAANIAKAAREKGIETLVEFFGVPLAERLVAQNRKSDLILANNVFAHVPDINGFVEALRLLLKPNGTAILEFPYLLDLLEKTEFDTIYHEHVYYFSVTALEPLFRRHNLAIVRGEKLSIHGGSLRLFIQHEGRAQREDSVAWHLKSAAEAGIASMCAYEGFSRKIAKIKEDLGSLVSRLRETGNSLAAYGASAKGSTLLNFVGLDATHLNFVADRSTYKQGRLTPGTHIYRFVAPSVNC